MRRLSVLVLVGSLIAAGCGGSAGTSTTASPSTTEAVVTTAPPVSTTTTPGTTASETTAPPATTAPPGTTAAPATTAVPRPVTTDPGLPSAVSGDLVDWDAVGPGWTLALYDATDVDTWADAPSVLYLVDPAGTRYEVAAWTAPPYPYGLADWAGTGDAALVRIAGPSAAVVDLRTGATTATMALSPLAPDAPLSFTTPTGRNIVALFDDGTTQGIERRTRSGAVLSVLAEQPTPTEWIDGLAWLYGYDGTFALVKDAGGISYVENDGTFVRDLWTPMDHVCTPVRWWTADSFLATCIGQGAAFPHNAYNQLWVLETDGTAGTPLNTIPPGSIPIVDFGLIDAWPTPTRTLAQWAGDCSTGGIEEIAPDGSFTPVAGPAGGNHWLVSIHGNRMVVLVTYACDMSEANLIETDLDGTMILELIPRAGNSFGVRGVSTLDTVYP